MAEPVRIYLDYNAGAPLRPEARDAMTAALGSGNASSVHTEGRGARRLVEDARASVARLVGGEPKNVTFTASGSEANATVLSPSLVVGGQTTRTDSLLVSAIEHPSVLAGGRFPPDRVVTIPVDAEGRVTNHSLAALLSEAGERGEKALVSVMLANNETGAIQPVADLAALAHEHGALFHTDAAQAVGRIPVDIAELGADFLTLSSHKLGGPQGAGAIVMVSEEVAFPPLIKGGGQERRRRAGSENVPAIAGFGAAASTAREDLDRASDWARWRDRFAAEVADIPGLTIFSGEADRLPQTLCLGISGFSAETLVIGLDLEGFAVSSGSACSSGKVGPSHVLAAMGVEPDLARSAIRVSFGWATTENDLDKFQTAFREVLERISTAKGGRAA